MKRFKFTFVYLFFITSSLISQTVAEPKDSVGKFDTDNIENYVFGSDIEGFSIKIDENNDLVFTKTVQDIKLSKDDIYNRALGFYIRTYKDAKSVLQQQDKEAGIIVGKGLFADFYGSNGAFKYFGNKITVSNIYSAYHIMRIDIKEGKARIIVTASNYDIKPIFVISNIVATGAAGEQPSTTKRIDDCQPIDTTSIKDRIEIEVSKQNISRNYYKSYMPIILESEKNAFVKLCKKIFATMSSLEKVLKEESSTNTENW